MKKKTTEQIVLNSVREKLSHKGQEYATYCSHGTPAVRVLLVFAMIAVLAALGYVMAQMSDSVEFNNINSYYLGRVHYDCGKIIISEQKYCSTCGAHTGQAKVEPYKNAYSVESFIIQTLHTASFVENS